MISLHDNKKGTLVKEFPNTESDKQWKGWDVKTIDDFKHYCPYDSIGMSRFIFNGLKKGKVYINNEEVESIDMNNGVYTLVKK